MKRLFSIIGAVRRVVAGTVAGGDALVRPGGRKAGNGRRLDRGEGSVFAAALPLLLLALFLTLAPVATATATTITNTAHADYKVGTAAQVTASNTVATNVRTPSKLEFMAYAPQDGDAESVPVAPTSYLSGGVYVAIPPPVPLGSTTPLALDQPLPLVVTSTFHKDEPVFVRLTDLDQNLDPTTAETVLVTVSVPGSTDTETLQLTETGPDTGVFTGYLPTDTASAVAKDGTLQVQQDETIQGSYTDASDSSDNSTATALLDPYGMVFDSRTGLPVNGATVTLIDATTSQPASVLGDDGVSSFPAALTSGGSTTDSGGRVYNFPPGNYRFPYVLPGSYILKITPPPGYRAPSVVATADLQNLPGGPFAIVNPGSRGEVFQISPGPVIHIDLPVDPVLSALRLTKTASKDTVAVGDFLQYQLTLENTGSTDIGGGTVSDRLPRGFRFKSGSCKYDGHPATDPTTSADGRTLLFSVGDLGAGKSITITYVLEVAVGTPLGPAENSASAAGLGVAPSNTARATVQVTDDFFSEKGFVVGRVFPNGCPGEGTPAAGVAGVRIYLEDGTYAVTDKNGMYHFEGVNPGTHVVQLDLETVPKDYRLVSCEENSRFARTPFSQFVDLQGGTMWRADFYAKKLPPKPPVKISGKVAIELASVLDRQAPGGAEVDYSVPLTVGQVPAGNLRLTVVLPSGVTYHPGSASRDNAPLADPEITENFLTFRLGDAPGGWSGKISFKGDIAADLKTGDITTKAMLTFDAAGKKNRRTPLVDNILRYIATENLIANPDITLRPHFDTFGYQLSEVDRNNLDRIIGELRDQKVTHIYVTGFTSSVRIAPRSRHIMADNYALSLARARSVADYLQAGLKLTKSQLTIGGRGPDLPVASNRTAKGRALNRRVEIRIVSEKIHRHQELKNIKKASGIQAVRVTALQKAEISAAEKARRKREAARTMPDFDGRWLAQAKPGLEIAWPRQGYLPPLPSIKIAIKHDPQKTLKVLMNGKAVDPLYLDSDTKRGDHKVALSLWIGVHLADGDNRLEAVESTADGKEVRRVSRIVHYSTSPVKAELVPEESRLIADGKTPPVVAIRLTDKDGRPARQGTIGEYRLDTPYLALQEEKELQKNPLLLSKSARLQYQIGPDGIAKIELQPTTRTGEAVLHLNLVNGEYEMRPWLSAGKRDWIVVGFGEGTAGYNTLAGNMENIQPDQVDDNYYQNGRVAFFAKGMIKGQWLLTMAYDTGKGQSRQDGSLFGTINPQKYYTIYGDATNQQYEAASARKLYLKIERRQFYALFGDYDTGLTVTELSRYSRSLNGLKSEMKTDRYDFNLFVSDTNQAFVKDELGGDGTSGLYHLSRRNIVANSEKITIETRDRFKSEVVLNSQTLTRYLDYDIDYDAGTIFFKSPIASRDENFNPIYIVVDYESADSVDKAYNYGGRGAVRFLNKRVEIGATHVHEGQHGAKGNLYGLDSTVKIDPQTTLKAEVATTSKEDKGVDRNGSAYLAEVDRQDKKLTGKLYLREEDVDFGLGQQMGSESGTRKLGLDANYRFTDQISLLTTGFRQYTLATDAYRDLAQLKTVFTEKRYTLNAGLLHAQDNLGDGETNGSDQITAGGSYNFFGGRLVLRAEHDQSLGGSNDNPDFPTRTMLGADYKLTQSTTVLLSQEFDNSPTGSISMTQIGFKTAPWTGGQLSSSLAQQATENGIRVFSVSGLKQAWQISKKWSVDAGFDRSYTISGTARSTPINVNVPAAVDTTDFTAVSAGASYKEEKWSWAGRVEGRTSDAEDKYSLTTGLYGEVREGLIVGGACQIFRTSAATGAKATTGDLRFSIASRPRYTDWIILERLDYLLDRQQGGDLPYDNWRLVNNLNLNWKRDRKTQVSLQYGAKYVNETIDGDDYSGYTDLMGVEGRYDITKKWDVGLTGKVLHSWQAGQFQYGSGASVGYNLVKNAWLSVGYNFIGFKDRDFSAADFTAQGPYVKFRFKFDQVSLREALQNF